MALIIFFLITLKSIPSHAAGEKCILAQGQEILSKLGSDLRSLRRKEKKEIIKQLITMVNSYLSEGQKNPNFYKKAFELVKKLSTNPLFEAMSPEQKEGLVITQKKLQEFFLSQKRKTSPFSGTPDVSPAAAGGPSALPAATVGFPSTVTGGISALGPGGPPTFPAATAGLPTTATGVVSAIGPGGPISVATGAASISPAGTAGFPDGRETTFAHASIPLRDGVLDVSPAAAAATAATKDIVPDPAASVGSTKIAMSESGGTFSGAQYQGAPVHLLKEAIERRRVLPAGTLIPSETEYTGAETVAAKAPPVFVQDRTVAGQAPRVGVSAETAVASAFPLEPQPKPAVPSSPNSEILEKLDVPKDQEQVDTEAGKVPPGSETKTKRSKLSWHQEAVKRYWKKVPECRPGKKEPKKDEKDYNVHTFDSIIYIHIICDKNENNALYSTHDKLEDEQMVRAFTQETSYEEFINKIPDANEKKRVEKLVVGGFTSTEVPKLKSIKLKK